MNPSTPAPVSNPLRILVLTTSPSTPPPALLKGSDLPIQTPYYSATIPIWHDAITSPQEWEREWLSPSASEVIQSIGAWVLTFPKPSSAQSEAALETIRSTLLTIHRVLSHHHHHDNNNNTLSSYNEPPLLLALGMPQPQRPVLAMTDESWEDLCRACGGWEWIDVEARGENAFGEKVGGERLREALEANVWDGIAGGEGDEEEDIDAFEAELRLRGDDDGGLELGMREAILKRQSTGDKDADTPAEDEGEEDDETTDKDIQVEELESMMLKMQAIKEKSATMPADERRRFAAKAVTEVMKTAVM